MNKQLKEENNRLSNELLITKSCFQLLEKYRNCLQIFCVYCECDSNIDNKYKFLELEKEYKTILNRKQLKIEDKNEENVKISQKPVEEKSGLNSSNDEINSLIAKKNLIIQKQGIDFSKINFSKLIKIRIEKQNENNLIQSNSNAIQQKVDSNLGLKTKTSQEFKCFECDIIFENKYKLDLHKSGFHSTNNKYKCDINECNFETNYYHLMKEHQNIHNSTVNKFVYIINQNKDNKTRVSVSSGAKESIIASKSSLAQSPGLSGLQKNLDLIKTKTNNKIPVKTKNTDNCIESNAKKQKISHISPETALGLNPGLDISKDKKESNSLLNTFKCHYNNCNNKYQSYSQLESHIREAHIIPKAEYCIDCDLSFETTDEYKVHRICFHSVIKTYSKNSNYLRPKEKSAQNNRNSTETTRKTVSPKSKTVANTRNSGQSSGHTISPNSNTIDKSLQFICNFINCSEAFVTKQELINHMIDFHTEKRLIKTETKPEIKIVDSNTNTDVDLNNDKSKAMPESFACQYPNCNFRYINSNSFKDHIKDTHIKNSFKCLDCESSFMIKYDYQRHRELIHPNLID